MGGVTSEVYQFLGRRIREERKRARLTLEALAGEAGISPSFLSYVENGGRRASLTTFERLAAALQLPLGELFHPRPRLARDQRDAASRQFAHIVRRLPESDLEAVLNVVRSVTRTMGKAGRGR